ncbi:MAG: ATP-binding protein [Pseudomonadota bacterium]
MIDDHADDSVFLGLPEGLSVVFETEFESSPNNVRDALAGLRSCLDKIQTDDNFAGSVEIAAAEALNNVVEHAYRNADIGPIKIATYMDQSTLYLAIVDSGAPLPDTLPPSKRTFEKPDKADEPPEGGFGWNLIMHLCSDVRYQRLSNRNHLLLRFARN